MVEFSGLPGIRRKKVNAEWVARHTPTGFFAALEKARVATAASDAGSVTVYIDDDGQYRCYFSRYGSESDDIMTTSKAAVRRWLKNEIPKMTEGYAP
jgi:hypothetical protein